METTTKKAPLCACCKRPFKRVNLPFYNLPSVGAVCVDCVDRAKKFYEVKETDYGINAIMKTFISNRVKNKVTTKLEYTPQFVKPFTLTGTSTDWGMTISFNTLDEVKALHGMLGKFIDECEV